MRRFRFRLDRVLKLRAHWERAARRALAEELSMLGQLEDAVRHIDHNLAVCRDDDSASSVAGLARALETGLSRRRTHLTRDIEAAERRVDLARETYRETRIGHRAMSNLRSRRWEAWRHDFEAETQAEFDEMARTRFMLRKRETNNT
ncbi:MAG: hypothetical protein V3U11_04980 [Planctomycetota bacterium]